MDAGIYMCGVCVRVSLEEFTEKQLLLGRGLKVRGGKETFFSLIIHLEFSLMCMC